MSNIIAGNNSDFLSNLCKGVGVDSTRVRRIVLDVNYANVVLVYVEMLGTDDLLNVSFNLNGIEVKYIKPNE